MRRLKKPPPTLLRGRVLRDGTYHLIGVKGLSSDVARALEDLAHPVVAVPRDARQERTLALLGFHYVPTIGTPRKERSSGAEFELRGGSGGAAFDLRGGSAEFDLRGGSAEFDLRGGSTAAFDLRGGSTAEFDLRGGSGAEFELRGGSGAELKGSSFRDKIQKGLQKLNGALEDLISTVRIPEEATASTVKDVLKEQRPIGYSLSMAANACACGTLLLLLHPAPANAVVDAVTEAAALTPGVEAQARAHGYALQLQFA